MCPHLWEKENVGQFVEKFLPKFEGQGVIFLLNRIYVNYRRYQDYISFPLSLLEFFNSYLLKGRLD